MNSYFKKSLAYSVIVFFTIFILSFQVFADSIAHNFTTQSASGQGSNGSTISVEANLVDGSGNDISLKYINKGNNSSVIGNYFTGMYYDDILGYFKVDSLSNQNENVRVTGSTSACATGYGYKLGGYAYSEYFGYVDFDYNSTIFVYYCSSDSSLHGYSYSESNGFQNFEGISFPIEVTTTNTTEAPTSSGEFTNEDTDIQNPQNTGSNTNTGNPNTPIQETSNFTPETIQNNSFQFDPGNESLFYIIK